MPVREGQMPVRLAADVEAIGSGELLGIAIGRADADVHVASGRDVDAAQHGIADGPAVAELVRAFHAQEFLDRGFHRLRMRRRSSIASAMTDEEIDGVADQIGGRLVTGVQKKNAIVNQFELARAARRRLAAAKSLAPIELGKNFRRIASAPLCNRWR